MKILFYRTRSGMTAAARELTSGTAMVCYRTRVACACRYPYNFRDGILLVDTDTDKVEYQLTRCRFYAKEGGAL